MEFSTSVGSVRQSKSRIWITLLGTRSLTLACSPSTLLTSYEKEPILSLGSFSSTRTSPVFVFCTDLILVPSSSCWTWDLIAPRTSAYVLPVGSLIATARSRFFGTVFFFVAIGRFLSSPCPRLPSFFLLSLLPFIYHCLSVINNFTSPYNNKIGGTCIDHIFLKSIWIRENTNQLFIKKNNWPLYYFFNYWKLRQRN